MEGENFRGKGQEKCEENGHGAGSSSSAANPRNTSPRNTFSKYDFVKVRVWLGENADHYYVLSRFLMSRMLTVTKIPHHVAIKIALELKKLLVDNSLLDVSQSDLEANLFKLMERRGYGEEYISRYKMMTRFHHQRVPFVILVCGTACVGKSTIATQLAQRLNLPNVLQTDMVYELLRTSTDAPLASTPIWTRDFNSPEELVTEFCRECRIVRKGLAGDLKKAVKDGKPIIIEGIHLDPSIYLMDEENQESNVGIAKQPSLKQMVADNDTSESKDDMKDCQSGDFISTEKCNSVVMIEKKHSLDTSAVDRQFKANVATMGCDAQSTSKSVDNVNDQSAELPNGPPESKEKTEKAATKPIIVPIVLKMADFDHKAVLEEWLSSRSLSESLKKDSEKVINNFKTIQSYLCSFESQGMTVVNTSATTFPQTLDWLHNHLLQCIERGCSLANPEAGS